MAKEVNIPELVIKNHDTKEVVAFVTARLKKYNSGESQSAELGMYIDILDALNKKLGGGSGRIAL